MSKRKLIVSHGDEREGDYRRKKEDMSLGRCTAFGMSKKLRLLDTRRRGGAAARRHLYLVVDDWERGYGVHRVGEDDFDPDPNAAPRTAECPIARIEAQHPHSWIFAAISFAAHGSKILATLPPEYSPGIPVLDVETLGMAVWPNPQSRGILSRPIYIPVGGSLLSFVNNFVEVLGHQPPPPTDRSWSWDIVKPSPPFVSNYVTCYAVHPDRRTVFVSVKDWKKNIDILDKRNSTFTFDMERREWTHVGEWILPFRGPAHYDQELDAWVGLCFYREGGAGRVCCCDVPPDAAADTMTMPAWKLGRDVFFDETLTVHKGATLVYMGESTFCTLETVAMPPPVSRHTRVVKMTRFVLKYDKEGDLCTTRRRTYASVSYKIAYEPLDRTENPVAFWI